MKNNPLAKIQKQFSTSLERAAFGYLKLGLTNFFTEQKKPTYAGNQATIGNLAIAVELMLKAFIAKKNLLLVFKNLPLEIRILITNPESIPSNFNWRSFEVELRAASYPTIELDECVALFYLFFPEQKQALQSHLKYLSKVRNASVHSISPFFQQEYEVSRVTYTALKVSDALKTNLVFAGNTFKIFPQSTGFLEEFQEKLVNKVYKAIENAKEKAKRLPAKGEKSKSVNIDYWKQEVTRCPVCGNLAILNGSTERITWSHGSEELNEPGLWFEPENFVCTECGLSLQDFDEMKLAGINSDSNRFDRTRDLDDFENGKILSFSYFDAEISPD